MTTIIVPRQWTKLDLLKAAESPGRPKGAVKGSYLDDLMALEKAVSLCRGCVAPLRRSASKFGYEVHPKHPMVRASCDLCREHDDQCTLFLHESLLPQPVKSSRRMGRRITFRSFLPNRR